jgi:diguanylate cyclase (GGDEF)-like protein
MDTKRPTIGFLAAYLSEDYEMEVWRGLMKAALAKGIDLVTIDGGSLEVPEPSQLQKVSIYALAKRMHMDGLIVSAAAVGNFAEEGHMEEFLSTFPRVPQVMIGKTIGKHPAVVIDNHNGMRAVVSHLIEVHHRKRIAFVAGHKTNPEAMARFDGYREALETHGIPYDPELVYSGAFQRSEGTLAVEAMWAKDRPGLRPDALAASTDSVAMYAVRELQHRGIAVPDEVPVTGFDDIHSCLSIDPPLTTIAQPFMAIGDAAVDLLISAIKGNQSAQPVVLPAEMRIRKSCGCLLPSAQSENEIVDEALRRRMENAVSAAVASGSQKPLIAFLDQEITAGTELFYSYSQYYKLLNHAFNTVGGKGVEALRAFGFEYLGQRADELILANAVRIRDAFVILDSFVEHNSFLVTPEAFYAHLREALWGLGVTAYLLCSHDGSPENAKIEHMLASGESFEYAIGSIAPSVDLMNAFIRSWKQSHLGGTLMMLPLYYMDEDLGFMIACVGMTDGAIYESLLRQLSNNLKGNALWNAVRSHSLELEQKVEERSADLRLALQKLERANQLLEEASFSDELTGLLNRRGFFAVCEKQIAQAMRRHRDILVFYVDLDGMKAINDILGHATGDDAICDISEILRKSFRQTDIIARLGGDEFTIFAFDMKPNEAQFARARLSEAVELFNARSGRPYKISFSMGVAVWDPGVCANLDQLLTVADAKLYEEKRRKKTGPEVVTGGAGYSKEHRASTSESGMEKDT